MRKQIRNFFEEVMAASGEERDHRFREWAKWVDSVNAQIRDGFAFEGNLIRRGITEIEVGKPRAILVSTVSGSRLYQTRHYRVLILEADGTLRATDIGTNDTRPGWALRIREELRDLLASLQARPLVILEDILAYLKVLPYIGAAGITITDMSPEGDSIEVSHVSQKAWMPAAEAAEYITTLINAMDGGDDDDD